MNELEHSPQAEPNPTDSPISGDLSKAAVPAIPEKPRFSASWQEFWAALCMYALAWIWFDLKKTAWLLIFVAGFVALAELLHRETKRPRESWFWLGCVLVLTASVALGRYNAWEEAVFPLFFLHIFAAWWLMSRSGRLSEGESGHLLPFDALNAFIVFPFKHFFLRIRCLWHGLTHLGRGEQRVKSETIVWSAAAVGAAVLLFAKAVQLLMRADSGFGALLKDFSVWFTFDFDWLKFFFSLPVGAYAFGLIAGAAREDSSVLRERGEKLKDWLLTLRKVPAPVFAVLLAAFGLLYLAFFILQGRYLFGAFTRTLPEGFVVAEYARQGFFELCRVMAVNFALLWLTARLPERPLRDQKLLRAFAAVLLVESLLFAVVAASKIGLYIDCFGFTPLRLQSMWLVCVLFAGCVCSLYSLFTGKKSFRVWMFFGAASLSLLCLY